MTVTPAPPTAPPTSNRTAPARRAPWAGLRSEAWALAGILLLAFALRAALIALKGPGFHFSDTAEYDAAARALLSGAGYELPRAPLYPAWMALGYRLFGVGNMAAVRWMQVPLGLAVVALSAKIASRAAGPRAGWIAGLLAAVSPTLVYTTSMLYPVALKTLLLLVCVGLAQVWEQGNSAPASLGLGCALAGLWLTDAIGAVPALALVPWGVALKPRSLVRWGQGLLALLIAAGLTFAAQPPSSGAARGSGFVAKAEYVLWVARHDPATVGGHRVQDGATEFHPMPARALVRRELHLMRTQPGAYAHDLGFEFVHFFAPTPDRLQTQNAYTGRLARWAVAAFFAPVLLLALLGAFAGPAPGSARMLLALVPLATAATYAFFFTQMRYRVPSEPEILVLAAIGALLFWRRGRAAAHTTSRSA
ncbi:MAG TPA: glycosyltransferase family 39 protein [Candidatus Eisenbacteria bacterium]|nr:glycosyltransferase family 39 protein [Candidatus Eisenbacteria bacterium]